MRRPARGPRIALAQISPALGDTAANMELHRAAVAKAVADEADLLVFPELSLAGYRLKDSVPDVAIARGGDTWKELEALSNEVAFVAGFVEESPDHSFYNASAWFEGGRCLAVHRKTYLPTYGMFDEQRYFARGRSIAAFDTKIGRVAMLICEDMLHPSAVTIAACDGATLLVVPSVSPARGVTGAEGEADANARSWEAYLQVMARSFGVQVAYCNRVGVEDGVTFWGGSEIVSAAGERLVKAAYYDEDQVLAVLSDDAVRRRRIANPLVRDEDLDLTINELSRIRGRAVPKEQADAPSERPRRPRRDDGEAPARFDRGPRSFDDSRPRRDFDDSRPRRDFDDRPRRDFGGPRPQRDFDRPREPRSFDGPREGRAFDRPRDSRPFDRDAPRPFHRDAPRPFDRDAGREDRPFRPRGPYEQRGGFGRPRRDDEGDRPRFGAPGGKPRFGAPRGRGAEGENRGGFGGEGGFSPPRARFAPRAGEDRGAGPRGGFDDGPPRPRQRARPEPSRKPFKPFAKGGKPSPRGRKDR